MNILCTFILLVAVVIGGKSDFSLQRPASSARIGELINAYMEWERAPSVANYTFHIEG
jgi:hypothetical protein